MKLQLLSDLHLERDPEFVATPAPGADMLVLAGDVGSYQPGSRLAEPDFGLRRFSPKHGWPTPVIFVPGNHEYDGGDFDEIDARLREACHRLELTWLEREAMVISGIRLVGTTLWTDFDALAQPGEPLASVLKKRGKAFRAADFYLKKTGTTRRGAGFLAEQVREQGLLCQSWLGATLNQPFDGKTVVITHFAPTLNSADPRYGVTPGTAGFCNALDPLVSHADLWLHGHLHCGFDYVQQGCHIVANPRGYADKDEQGGFDPLLCVVVGNDSERQSGS